jgi:hypothetical protein
MFVTGQSRRIKPLHERHPAKAPGPAHPPGGSVMPQWKWNNEDSATALVDQSGDLVMEAMAGIAGDAWLEFWDNKARPLIAAAPEMYALLKEIEFCMTDWGGVQRHCPVCEGRDEHKHDCRLSAVLKAVEGEE